MFDFLKNKKEKIYSPVKGKLIPLSEVEDPTFAQEMVGPGAAIIPSDGKIYAMQDGVVSLVFSTLHALFITTESGAEILIHIGIDTVNLKGEGFKAYVKANDKVKKGDLLMEVDLDLLKQKGYDTTIPVILTNIQNFKKLEVEKSKDVNKDDVIYSIYK